MDVRVRSELVRKMAEEGQDTHSAVLIVDFEPLQHINLVFVLITLDVFC